MAESSTKQNNSSSRMIERDGRTVGYTIVEAKNVQDRSTAVVVFYALSGCSYVFSKMELEGYRCSALAVDRPSCGATSPISTTQANNNQGSGCCHSSSSPATSSTLDPNDDEILQRIRGHAQDVIEVLKTENITTVYIVGVCIGHPYAVEVCRQLQPSQNNDNIKVGGLTLVAPFVSTMCPNSWYVARFGAWVPSSVLYGGTEVISSVGTWIVPHLLRPSAIKKMLTPEEEEMGGWTQKDFEDVHQLVLEMNPITQNVKGIEARVGTSKIWQTEVCDRFAVESGYGLQLDRQEAFTSTKITTKITSPERIPMRVHACKKDKLATLASLEWVTKRCYGSVPITIENDIHSHEVMTFFAGPPRTPILLHKIVREWNLLD